MFRGGCRCSVKLSDHHDACVEHGRQDDHKRAAGQYVYDVDHISDT